MSAHAANSGNLDLQGTVAAVCDILVTADPGASSLNLGAAATDLFVASVNETCNGPIGYTVTVQSANSSSLEPLGSSPDSVPFTFKYDGSAANLSGGGAVTITNANLPTGAAGVDKSVEISYANPGFIAADTYTDTLTFTIAAK